MGEKTEQQKPRQKSATQIDGDGLPKRATRISQANVPTYSVEEALKIPQAIWDHLAGKGGTPIQVCQALDMSPTSSKWRDLAGASIAYGFTSGGCNAKSITLEPLGKRAVAPTEEGDDLLAIQQAVCTPSVLKQFFEYYDGKKFPKDSIAENMLIEWGVPKDRATHVLKLIKENGQFAGLLSEIKGGLFVSPNNTVPCTPTNDAVESDSQGELPEELLVHLGHSTVTSSSAPSISPNNNVFISHGKNRAMVESLKELLVFGGFTPIVSVERETTAISVPEKVLSDMRSCCAGIIHIEEEQALISADGAPQKTLNPNVLIEIGAAIALYGKKIILLCKKEISLPSNLQGLYRCEYEGDKLDIDSTMKLLKTFNSFKTA